MHSIHKHFNEEFRRFTNSACDDVQKKLGEVLVEAFDKYGENPPAFVEYVHKQLDGFVDICVISAASAARDETREYMKGLNTMGEQEIVELVLNDDAVLDYVVNPTDTITNARTMRRL